MVIDSYCFEFDESKLGHLRNILNYLNDIKRGRIRSSVDDFVDILGASFVSSVIPLNEAEVKFAERTYGEDIEEIKKIGALPKRDVGSLLTNVVMGDYEILPICKRGKGWVLQIDVGGHPFGGTDGLGVILENLGAKIQARAGYEDIELRWDWWNKS